MAWVKCSKCGKRISDKVNKCDKCGCKIKPKKNVRDYKNIILGFILFFVMGLLIYTLYGVKDEVLYVSEMINLYIFIFISLLIIFLSLITFRYLILNKKVSKLYFFNLLLLIFCFCFGVYYSFLGIKAFRYDNSLEVYNLTDNHDLKTAKMYKKKLDDIFEMEDDISIRNVNIRSLYNDEDVYVLFLDDFYNNYKLKFYVNISDDKIVDVYWLFNDKKFYLVKEGIKEDKFSFYYAMSIISVVLGEDVSGLANLDDEIKDKLVGLFDESANMIISYDDFVFKDDKFVYSGSLSNMDYSVNMEEVEFDIIFSSLDKPKNKKVWYYGDSSFDYVDWNVKIK